MKAITKYFIYGLLLAATLPFAACDTDIEPVDQHILKPGEQNPEQYAAYLAALKAYKAGEHYIVYASLDNAPEVPLSEKAFLRSLPDSLDIVSLRNSDRMSGFDLEDIPVVQAKGTKILYSVDYNALRETHDPAAFSSYLDGVAARIAELGLDGATVVYDGPIDEAAAAAATAVVAKLSDKLLMVEGNPLFIARADHEAVDYFALNTSEVANTFTLRSEIAYAKEYAGIDPAKLLITALPSGRLTDEALEFRPAIAEMAKSVITLGPLAGMGIYHVGEDYYDPYVNYRQTKQAIDLLNPAASN